MINNDIIEYNNKIDEIRFNFLTIIENEYVNSFKEIFLADFTDKEIADLDLQVKGALFNKNKTVALATTWFITNNYEFNPEITRMGEIKDFKPILKSQNRKVLLPFNLEEMKDKLMKYGLRPDEITPNKLGKISIQKVIDNIHKNNPLVKKSWIKDKIEELRGSRTERIPKLMEFEFNHTRYDRNNLRKIFELLGIKLLKKKRPLLDDQGDQMTIKEGNELIFLNELEIQLKYKNNIRIKNEIGNFLIITLDKSLSESHQSAFNILIAPKISENKEPFDN